MNNWLETESKNLASRFIGVNRAAFARENNVPGGQAMIYQHINGRRPIGLDAAKAYAKGFGCSLHDISPRLAKEIAEASVTLEAAPNQANIPSSKSETVTVNAYDAGGSMGKTGVVLHDQPGIISRWDVSKQWLNQNIKSHTGVANLCIVTGFGDSMVPMFNPGDPLLVDLGVKSVDFDAVYFFRIDGDGYVKRLQRIPTEDGLIIRAISENKKAYEPFDITKKMDFEVLGRVLKVWRSQDF